MQFGSKLSMQSARWSVVLLSNTKWNRVQHAGCFEASTVLKPRSTAA